MIGPFGSWTLALSEAAALGGAINGKLPAGSGYIDVKRGGYQNISNEPCRWL